MSTQLVRRHRRQGRQGKFWSDTRHADENSKDGSFIKRRESKESMRLFPDMEVGVDLYRRPWIREIFERCRRDKKLVTNTADIDNYFSRPLFDKDSFEMRDHNTDQAAARPLETRDITWSSSSLKPGSTEMRSSTHRHAWMTVE